MVLGLPEVLRRALPAAAIALLLAAPPAAAFDLFATHEVTAQFATRDGKPMADAEVRVFGPGSRDRPVLTGRTDSHGKFVFPVDRDGFWSAEARTKSEVAQVTIRVGGPSTQRHRLSPFLVIGGLAALLALAFWYRLLRRRGRRR